MSYQLINKGLFRSQIVEAVALHCLLAKPSSSSAFNDMTDWSLSKWNFYRKEGSKWELQSELESLEGLVVCDNYKVFDKMNLKDDVTKLPERTVFFSSMHNSPLADRFTVDHTHKKVFAFEVSDLTYDSHKMSFDTTHRFMTNLNMFQRGYKLVYIYVTDKLHGHESKPVKKNTPTSSLTQSEIDKFCREVESATKTVKEIDEKAKEEMTEAAETTVKKMKKEKTLEEIMAIKAMENQVMKHLEMGIMATMNVLPNLSRK
jgi:hypothetical protein